MLGVSHPFSLRLPRPVLMESMCVCRETLGCRGSAGGSAGLDSEPGAGTAGTSRESTVRNTRVMMKVSGSYH